MKTRALIIDDEALARGRLRKMLSREPDVEVIGDCDSGPKAIACIREQRPDLIFLDIGMPEVDGFEVLRSLPAENQPAVIFVTAHDRHAVEAFEVQAVDYLLKPVTQGRLQQALRHARKQAHAQRSATLAEFSQLLRSAKPASPYLARIPVRTGNQTLFVGIEEIDFVESAANYLVLRTGAGSHVLRETLSHLETRLPPDLFVRISRSVIVNLNRVKALQAGPEGQNMILLRDGRQFTATRPAREIRQRLQFGQAE
jgi:two-component system, LytTR family, response regulator